MTADAKRIGISVVFQHSFFSNGQSSVALALADSLQALGHSIVFVNIAATNAWWDDCAALKEKYEVRHLTEWDAKGYDALDMFIDIDGYISPAHRNKVSKNVVVFVRKPTVVHELESAVYPVQQPIRNLRECSAVWTWAHYNKQDVHILELLACGRPVFRIPYLWSSAAAETHGASLPAWLDATQEAEQSIQGLPWTAHVAETNTSMCSNLTLPVVIASYAKTHTKVPMMEVMCHNSQQIEKQQFFQENVYAHTKVPELRVQYLGRQRVADWRQHGKSFILSHMRFNTVKAIHLDAAWNGIPIVHNSPVLRIIGCGLERLYYSDNSIVEANKAIELMHEDYIGRQGIFAEGALETIRATIRERFSARVGNSLYEALTNAVNGKAAVAVAEVTVVADAVATAPSSVLRVGFSDLWQDANTDYNFWTLLLTEACRQLKRSVRIEPCLITETNAADAVNRIDVLFFGPFGTVYKQVAAEVPKVHITGENTPSVFGHGVFLNLGFDETDEDRGVYRFPLWKQYLDWFGADQDRLINPKTMPLDSVVSVDTEALLAKKKFCAFVVSNPTNPVRNAAFQWLSQYKKVDSAGRLFNNIGEDIFTITGGGGGGELKKLEFLKDYKFCLTYENSRRDGYVTEKLLAAKAAGCVPIYWGAQNVCDDFAEGSFLNANNFQTPDELISAVRALDEDDDAWLAMVTKPAFRVEAVRKELAHIARLIVAKVLGMDVAVDIPEMLGGGTTAEAAALGLARREKDEAKDVPTDVLKDDTLLLAPSASANVKWNGKTMLVTFATQRFVQSLLHWLQTSAMRVKADPSLRIRVYLGDDVDTMQQNLLKSQYPDVEVCKVPSKTLKVDGFADLWEPQHFAWKLWIYQQLVREAALEGTLVWYMDAGSIIVRWPEKWLSVAASQGLCMLEDNEQKNDQWCHKEFCSRLAVTGEELAAHQVVGGIMAFVCGAPLAWRVFTEAWTYGKVRDIIVGPKWSGTRTDGRPYGHRHDQSILSILRLRHKVPVEPLATVYNHESLRRTAKSGACLYVHRGHIKEHINFAPRIGEVHLINLARRPDRIKRFKENHGVWTKEVCLRPAFDGKQLTLTPALARLFAPNDFFWKKAVMGCALSHLSLWLELASESGACENYLVLEDDVKFSPDWLARWEEAAKEIPADYDVLYLGGVLPPNRKGYEGLLEPVNASWARVRENQMFGQPTPTRYFHFCNYAYILSRRGAQKILQGLGKRGGYYTSADHMICNRVEDMNHYMLNPLIAGCYQDDDPKYANSQFNDFSRVDAFDSDLWNNNDRFAEAEIRAAIGAWNDNDLPNLLGMALVDGRKVADVAVAGSAGEGVITGDGAKTKPLHLYTVGTHQISASALMEYSWLRELCGETLDSISVLAADHEPLDTHPIFVIMRPHIGEYLPVFARYESLGMPFSVLHLSDEAGVDPIQWVSYKSCVQVLRIYPRAELKGVAKVVTIPLGPNRRLMSENVDLKIRKTIWSFFGTGWQQRAEKLAPWADLEPFEAKFYSSWADKEQLSAEEYSQVCLRTVFMPCPGGQNPETFRFYEALEHGCVPVYVRCSGDDLFWAMLQSHLPLREYSTWDESLKDAVGLLQNPAALLAYREALMAAWTTWKAQLLSTVRAFFIGKA
jgi:GR25 family glycosyltransferase involved in LPS biosynthesis